MEEIEFEKWLKIYHKCIIMEESEFEKLLKIYQYEAKETKIVRQKYKDGSFLNKENKYLMDDLFDDTKIKEESVAYKKTRIGKMYQVDI